MTPRFNALLARSAMLICLTGLIGTGACATAARPNVSVARHADVPKTSKRKQKPTTATSVRLRPIGLSEQARRALGQQRDEVERLATKFWLEKFESEENQARKFQARKFQVEGMRTGRPSSRRHRPEQAGSRAAGFAKSDVDTSSERLTDVIEVGGSVTKVVRTKVKGGVRTSCAVSIVVGDRRGKILMMTGGEASVGADEGTGFAADIDGMRDKALRLAIASAHTNVVKYIHMRRSQRAAEAVSRQAQDADRVAP